MRIEAGKRFLRGENMAFDRNQLLRLLDESFGGRAWHGTNLRGSIRGVAAQQASWRPAPGRHNIWEIVLHAAYWKHAVRRQLVGGPRGSFAYSGSNWFVKPAKETANTWKKDLALLHEENRLLREVLASLPAARLQARSARTKWTLAELALGVAFHDVYHAGQIQILKRLQK
jgi:hypothetical protein